MEPRIRPGIALLAAPLDAGLYYQKWQVWAGAARAARARDAGLLYIAGGEARRGPQAVLYDLISAGQVQGIISWNGIVTPWQPAEAQGFLLRYHPLPIVNIGFALSAIPSVVFDQAGGVAAAVAHLIDSHARRRIAFLTPASPHPGLAAGFEGYAQALLERNAFSANLAVPAAPGSALAALEAQGLQPGRDYEAIICPLDSLAMQVIVELQERGVRVPEDVAVIGVHDGQEARLVMPSLTTVRLPWEQAGAQATDILLDLIAGKPAPPSVLLTTPLVVRRSCGCLDARTQRAALVGPETPGAVCDAGGSFGSRTGRREAMDWALAPEARPPILADMAAAVGRAAADATPGWAEALLAGFLADLRGPAPAQPSPRPPRTLVILEDQLRLTAAASGSLAGWHDVISALRHRILPLLAQWALEVGSAAVLTTAEGIFQQMRLAVAQAVTRQEARRTWTAMARAQILQEFEAAAHVVTTEAELWEVLAAFLPRLEIPTCYLSLYIEPARPNAGLRLVFRFERGQRVALPSDGLRLPSAYFAPPDALQTSDQGVAQTDLVVEALYFGEEQIGVLVCTADPAQGLGVGTAFETLRSQLSSALTGVRLRRALEEAHQHAEEARRQADEANQLKSRFLALVSHELRTPLAQIVGLTELANLDASRLSRSPEALAHKLLAHHRQIHVSAQHLDRLIRDVLDLARQQVGQLRVEMQPLDLRDLLVEVSTLGEHMAAERKLAWRSILPQHPLPVLGDRARLQQVLLNLLANAVKFTPQGEVALRAGQQAGWIMVEVSDTGIGVPPGEQAAIFDEFHQAPGAVARGFGGLGLGLAVTRRLVELHGGKVGLRSAGLEGQGSVFFFTLPVAPEEFRADTAGAAGAPAGADAPAVGPALIIGRSPESGRELWKRLTADGYEVVLAQLHAAEELLPLVQKYAPGAVIIECAPDAEWGWEMLRALKEHPLTRDVPVILFRLIEACGCGEALTFDILTKPVGAAQLASLLARFGPDEQRSQGSPTILIVDDDAETVRVHELLVRERLRGSNVLTATGGREAMAILRTQTPDLILLDLLMPEVDGFQVLAALRADPRTRYAPVVVLTGQALSDLDMARLAHGVDLVLSKGVLTTAQTIARISDILAHAPRLGAEGQRQVRRAMAYIHAHYAEPITRRDLAAHLGLHEDSLSHYFGQEVGISLVAYLNRYRVQQACKLLETSQRTIIEIALAVGFGSHSYFTRVFAAETGMTPTAYRQQHRAGAKV